jgi:hypothetical protein
VRKQRVQPLRPAGAITRERPCARPTRHVAGAVAAWRARLIWRAS